MAGMRRLRVALTVAVTLPCRGGHHETHGGHTLNIDSNYMRVH